MTKRDVNVLEVSAGNIARRASERRRSHASRGPCENAELASLAALIEDLAYVVKALIKESRDA